MRYAVIVAAILVGLSVVTAGAEHGGVGWRDKPGPLELRVMTNAQGKFSPYGDDLGAQLALAVGYWNESPDVELSLTYVDACPTKASGRIVVCVGEVLNGSDYTEPIYKGGSTLGGAWIQINQSAYVSDVDGGHHEWRFCHELGHALGLGHPDAYNDSCLSQGWRPNQHDYDELALLYGG